MNETASPPSDLPRDVLGRPSLSLDALFSPRGVAVIGASEKPGSVGRALMANLIGSPFGGAVYPINPNHPHILGVRAYPSIAEVPAQVDLAVIATPAASVPGVVGQCVEAHVRAAIVISAGFRECGASGRELETEVLRRARRGDLRLLGPNCLGLMRPPAGLNATFAAGMARPGGLGFISQSGAMGTAVLDWSLRENLGFSAFVSVGSMLDLSWGDLIDYLGDDPLTKSIVLYMESIGDARSFLSAAREVALTKPIVVLKSGRTEGAARAVLSHTGAMAGGDEALDAAFRRCGVLRVDTIEDLFAMAEALALQPRPKGKRLAIVTNAGGPGVLAADALVAGGGALAELAPPTIDALGGSLPAGWSRGNPVDVLGDADPARFAKAVEVVARDPNSDGLLVILTPQAMTDPTLTAERLRPFAKLEGKPILASWMGGTSVAAGQAILTHAGIPTFPYPEVAARAFQAMWRLDDSLRALYETPTLAEVGEAGADRALAETILLDARRAGRPFLTEYDSKRLLSAYGIPTVETRLAADEAEAARAAEALGFPVAVKLHSETITHKTDVGGVRLDLADAPAVRHAYREIEASVRRKAGEGHFLGVTVQPMIDDAGYELLVGSAVDPQLGPVLLFGTGGVLTEVYRDRCLGLPPLNSTLARRMMERTRVFKALAGTRGRDPVDLGALEQLLVRFSRLIAEHPAIREVDINPLLASPDRLIVLDARVVVHGPDVPDERLPHMSVRPYPLSYVAPWTLKDGTAVTIRPVRPEDEPLFVRMHEALSERSVYFRYFHPSKLGRRTAHERLRRICFIDYDREMALVAERRDPGTGGREIVGVGRLIKVPRTDGAEFALLVADAHQRQGLGAELLRRLARFARDEGLARIHALVLPENTGMLRICTELGASSSRADPAIRVEIDLSRAEPAENGRTVTPREPEPAIAEGGPISGA
jgi:acetyltransferase